LLFSQRKGYKPVKSVIQKNSMDEDLRNGLWNIWYVYIGDKVYNYQYLSENRDIDALFKQYWRNLFKKPIDTMPKWSSDGLERIRKYFFACNWYEVYDFIEFTVKIAPAYFSPEKFANECNIALEKELSAYRIIDKRVVEITSEEEIDSIDSAIKKTSELEGVQEHLRSALSHLSDRKNPDFRNSIKESISAVEALTQVITQDNKATLGSALRLLEDKIKLHPALSKSFSKLYGYTSDADGIRHAMLEKDNLTFTDAKYMLVACTGFINYLIGKLSECKVDLT
jgi:hypothetical protein